MPEILIVENLSSGYGNLQILNDISIKAEVGQVTVVVGPNGSGKSTLLKSIAGLTTIFQGTITLEGKAINRLAPYEIARRGLAYLPQTESIFTQLSVSENVRMAGYTVPKSEFDGRLQNALKMFPRLNDYMGTRAQNLSGGERQMVAMTMALIRQPKVIMLDEPTANLSPKLATQVLKNIESLAGEMGMAVLLVEQNARRALEIGSMAYLLVGGRKVYDGPAKELLSHQELASMYLGLKAA